MFIDTFAVLFIMNTSKSNNKICKNCFSKKGCRMPYCNASHLVCKQLSQKCKIGEFRLVIGYVNTSGRVTKRNALYKIDIVTDFVSFWKPQLFLHCGISMQELHNSLLLNNSINSSIFRYNEFKLLVDEIINHAQSTIYTIFLLNNNGFVSDMIDVIKGFYKGLYRLKTVEKKIYKIDQ